jgi:tetratricopeptide (TPR) repeat protein
MIMSGMARGKSKPNIILSIVSFILLFASSGYAAGATYEQRIANGVSYMEAEDFRKAAAEFDSALKDRPGDFTATLYLGIAQSRLGDKESETTLKKALSAKPGDPRTSLELGIWYFNKAAYTISRDYFRNAVSAAPNTLISATAEEYLRVIAFEKTSRPWMLNVSLGGEYDSNVVLNGAEGALPQGISNKSDWSTVAYLKGRYDFLKNDRAEASVAYTLYQSLYAKLSDFDVSYHLLDLRATYALSPHFSVRGAGAFEYTFIGGNDYDAAYSLSPALVISEGNGYSTVVEYIYKKSRFMNSELFFNNSDRTGSDNLVGITQNMPLHRAVLARIGFSHDVDSTRQAFWSYRGDKALIGLQFALPRSIYLDLYGEYYHRNYRGPFEIPGEDRKDRTYTASISATRLLSEHYSATVGQVIARNKSNTPVFDYKRAVTGLFLNARF